MDKIPAKSLESIRAESLMKASFMAKRVTSATEFTWHGQRAGKDGLATGLGLMSPKPNSSGGGGGGMAEDMGRGGCARTWGGGGDSPFSTFKSTCSSPGSLALARITLAEGLGGGGGGVAKESVCGGGGGQRGGIDVGSHGSRSGYSSGGYGDDADDWLGGTSRGDVLSPVVRHNPEVSTARSVIRHSHSNCYTPSGDPLTGTPFLGPGSSGRRGLSGGAGGSVAGSPGAAPDNLGVILRSNTPRFSRGAGGVGVGNP